VSIRGYSNLIFKDSTQGRQNCKCWRFFVTNKHTYRILVVIIKIVKKGRNQKKSKEIIIVHNLFITFDPSKFVNKKVMVGKHLVFNP
jgi:hypothetical protein